MTEKLFSLDDWLNWPLTSETFTNHQTHCSEARNTHKPVQNCNKSHWEQALNFIFYPQRNADTFKAFVNFRSFQLETVTDLRNKSRHELNTNHTKDDVLFTRNLFFTTNDFFTLLQFFLWILRLVILYNYELKLFTALDSFSFLWYKTSRLTS